jgi:hypothetical protein
MKWILSLLVSLLSFSAFAAITCGQALPANDPGFCGSFQSVAVCHCINESGLGEKVCKHMSMDTLYNLMIAKYKTQQKACDLQHDTTPQTCMDDWNCYRLGGKDSQGQACSSTGRVCPK